MAESTVVAVDLTATEEHLDRLLAKAERLSKLIDEIDGKIGDIDENIATAEGIEKKPQIVWSISLGEIKNILLAPKEAYGEQVQELIANDLFKLINGVKDVPENDLTKGKIISLCK